MPSEPHTPEVPASPNKNKITRRVFIFGSIALALTAAADYINDQIEFAHDQILAKEVGSAKYPFDLGPGNFYPFISQNWLSEVGDYLKTVINYNHLQDQAKVWNRKMPAAFIGPESAWGPIVSAMSGPSTTAVKHSSSSTEACYRLMQGDQVENLILVCPYHKSDLGQGIVVQKLEEMGGRLSQPFDFSKITHNAKNIYVIAPQEDEIIPREITEDFINQLQKNQVRQDQIQVLRPHGVHEIDKSPEVLDTIKRTLYNIIQSRLAK